MTVSSPISLGKLKKQGIPAGLRVPSPHVATILTKRGLVGRKRHKRARRKEGVAAIPNRRRGWLGCDLGLLGGGDPGGAARHHPGVVSLGRTTTCTSSWPARGFTALPTDEDEWYDRKTYKAAAIRLKTLVERGVDRFLYVYDFGDNWHHDVIVEEVRDGDEDTEYPAFVDGARRAPPEDVGSTDGFMEFLEAVLDASHEEHRRMTEWYGGPFDPEDIDEHEIRQVLGIYAVRRRGPLASHRSGKRGGSRSR